MLETPFNEKIDELLLYERDDLNTGWVILSKKWTISVDLLKARYRYLIDLETEKDKKQHSGETTCLKCRKRFISEHRINIRTCDPCKLINDEFAHNMREAVTFGR